MQRSSLSLPRCLNGFTHLRMNLHSTRSAVSKLNYLAQTTRSDIMYTTHQIAKYSSDRRQSHGEAILYLVRYLKKTRDIGLKFTPDPTKGFECYCDSDFSGLWNKEFASVDPSTANSQSGWIIFYAGCPISWASKLQSQVALSTTLVTKTFQKITRHRSCHPRSPPLPRHRPSCRHRHHHRPCLLPHHCHCS
jgi:hypothetical protein